MRIRRLSWRSYRIPFRRPFSTVHGALAVREGVLVTMEAETGIRGLGEAAPLAAFDGGDVDDVDRLLRGIAPSLIGLQIEELVTALNGAFGQILHVSPVSRRSSRTAETVAGRRRTMATFSDDSRRLSLLHETTCSPTDHPPKATIQIVQRLQGLGNASLRCALETACLDLLAREADVTLAALLSLGAPLHRSVPLNATVSDPDARHAADSAARAIEGGYRCVKLKVGMLATPDDEAARVSSVRAAIGSKAALRLDANGAWDVDRAIATIRACERFDLDLIEQPTPARSIDDLVRVRAAVNTPIAADEALVDPRAALEVIRRRAAEVLVLKPMALGGIGQARRLALLAQSAGLRSIVTTTLDSGVGFATALHIAASLPFPLEPCGLATADMLESDLLVRPILVTSGSMTLPEEPGLGVTLCEAALDQYAGTLRGEAGPDGPN